jgi:hypothetical protein
MSFPDVLCAHESSRKLGLVCGVRHFSGHHGRGKVKGRIFDSWGGFAMRGLLVAAAAIGMMAPLNGKAQAAPELSVSTRRYYSETQARTGKEQYTQ